jgi:hypothetical protein
MNVFLDTTVLYNDPFFRSNYNRLLLEKSKVSTFKLYISIVVVKELRKQLERNIEKFNKQIKSSKRSIAGNCKDVNKYKFDNISIEEELKYFDEFYANISKDADVIIVNYEDEEEIMLEKVFTRALNKQKPFKENGEGFKDALLWESYIQYASYRKMKNCILISANVRDFASSDHKKNNQIVLNLHTDLVSEFPYFLKLYKNSQDFINGEELKSIRKNAPYWLGEQYQDEVQMYNVIFSENHYTGNVISAAKKLIFEENLFEKKGIDFVNYIEVTNISINEFKILGFEEYENEDGIHCFIELRITANFDMDLYFQKNQSNENEESDLKFIDIIEQEFIFESSAYIDKDWDNIDHFQVDKTKIKNNTAPNT